MSKEEVADEIMKDMFPMGYCVGGNYEGYKRAIEKGYSKALNDLSVEVFKIIDWGENHGNGQLISRTQVKNIISSLNTGGKS